MNDISSDLITRGSEATAEYLAHHGVLGMKWGIRKDGKPQGWQGDSNGKNKIDSNDFVDNTKSAKTMEKKFKNDSNIEKVGKDLYMPKGYISDKKFKNLVVNHEQERLDSVNSINRKYKKYNFPDMTRASNVMFLGMMYSSDKTTREPFRNMMHELDASQRTNHKKYISDLKNFDDSKLSEKDKAVKKELLNAIERDDKDWNLTYTLAMATEKGLQNDEKINHSSLNEEFLAHHGVLGMKWGIRKDGKPQGWQGGAGKAARKVGSGAKRVAKGTASAAVKSRAKIQQVQAKRNEKKALEEARLNELKLEDRRRQMSSSYSIASTTRSARTLSKHMDSLSDAELKQRINRLKLENEVRQLSAQERERSRSWVSKTLEASAKNSVKSIVTYGMTKSGRKLVDGLLDEIGKDDSGKDNSGGNKQSIVKTLTSSTSSSGPSSYTTSDGNKSVSYKTTSGDSKSSGYSVSSGGSKSGYTIAPGGSKRSSYTFSPGSFKSGGYSISPSGSKSSRYSISPSGSKSSGYSISPGILGSSDYKMSSTMDKGSDFILNYIEPSEKYR